jgi:hypothetical protein
MSTRQQRRGTKWDKPSAARDGGERGQLSGADALPRASRSSASPLIQLRSEVLGRS